MATLFDSYSESNVDSYYNIHSANNNAIGQAFNAGASKKLGSCKFFLKKTGSPDNVTAKIYAVTGTFGSTAKPTGEALATSDVRAGTGLTTGGQLEEFVFSGANQIDLTSGTKYVIVCEHTGGNSSNFISIGVDVSDSSHGGNLSYYYASSPWTAYTNDAAFYVYSVDEANTAKDALLLGCG